jgi:hypothetical protein
MRYLNPNRVVEPMRVEQRRPRIAPEVVRSAHWKDAAPHRNRWSTAVDHDGQGGAWHRRPTLG